MSVQTPPEKISLDSVEQALAHWRANKSAYPKPGIPDSTWLQIFSLESASRTGSRLRAMFNLNSQQYKKKRAELITHTKVETSTPSTTPSIASALPFAEVCVENKTVLPLSPEAQHTTKTLMKTLKTTKTNIDDFLDPTTVVVECIRQDGQRLKIHTCTQRIEAIIQSFYHPVVAA